MPNWCRTCFKAVGDREQLDRLHKIFIELEEMPVPYMETDLGPTWLGNLVIHLGGDWQKVYCRGSWDYLEMEEDGLVFDCETAWDELPQLRRFIEEKFPGLKIYYRAEEPAMDVYKTNDASGIHFPERYYLDIEDHALCIHHTLEDLCEEMGKVTGNPNLTTYADCQQALADFVASHPEVEYYALSEYAVLDN